jgi:hypothetical protein
MFSRPALLSHSTIDRRSAFRDLGTVVDQLRQDAKEKGLEEFAASRRAVARVAT